MTKSHLFTRFILKHFSTILTKGFLSAAGVFLVTFLAYYLTNPSLPKRFDHQIYLADSLLKGRVDLVHYPIKYHDVFNINGKKYTAFGLGPILLILPLVAIFGFSLNLTLIAMMAGSLNVALFWNLSKYFTKNQLQKSLRATPMLHRGSVAISSSDCHVANAPRNDITALRLLATIGFSFGTIHWFSATVGSSWYFSMIVAVFFIQLTLLFIWKRRFILAGAFFGLAVLSRFPLALAAPGILLMIHSLSPKIKTSGKFLLGTIPFAILFFAYNYLRFGNILETGYQFANWQYMTELNTSSFGIKYFPKNFYTFAFRSFDFITEFPYLQVSFGGIALLFSSPWLFLSLAADIKNRLNQLLAIIIIPILGSSLLYFTPGIGIQPSWRFVMDFLPFTALLSLDGMKKVPKQLTSCLILVSLVFTSLGLYWAKISGW